MDRQTGEYLNHRLASLLAGDRMTFLFRMDYIKMGGGGGARGDKKAT